MQAVPKEDAGVAHTKNFLYLPAGRGATVAFCEESKDIPATMWTGKPITLGQFFCDTSVGVCIPLDDKRCFFAHLNAERGPRTWINHKDGQNIRDQVYDKLNDESKIMKWDHVNPRFAESIIVCCNNPEMQWKGSIYPQEGYWIILGIRDFLEDRSSRLRYEAEAALERGNRIAEMRGQSADVLLRYMIAEHNDPQSDVDSNILSQLQDDAMKAKLYTPQSKLLRERANFQVQREARGCLIWPENGRCHVIKWISEVESGGQNDEMPQAIAGYCRREELSDQEANTRGWSFTTQRIRPIGDIETIEARKRAHLFAGDSAQVWLSESSHGSSEGEDSDPPVELPLLRKPYAGVNDRGKGNA